VSNATDLFKRNGASALVNNIRERSPRHKGVDEFTVKRIGELP
jgi:hypothetical protein